MDGPLRGCVFLSWRVPNGLTWCLVPWRLGAVLRQDDNGNRMGLGQEDAERLVSCGHPQVYWAPPECDAGGLAVLYVSLVLSAVYLLVTNYWAQRFQRPIGAVLVCGLGLTGVPAFCGLFFSTPVALQ